MLQYIKLLCAYLKMKMAGFFTDEKGDVNIVSIVVLIGIAVVLALVFKDAISNLITDLLNNITDKAKEATETN